MHFIVIYPRCQYFPFSGGSERIDKYEDHDNMAQSEKYCASLAVYNTIFQ
jgi:hypothetical protein